MRLDRHRHAHAGLVLQHQPIQPLLRRLAQVVQLLAQPVLQFAEGVLVLQRRVHAPIQRHGDLQLPKIGLHHRSHVRVLQLAGDPRAVMQHARDAPGRATPRPPPRARRTRTWVSQSAPSSLAMRRRTKGQPIGGALACSVASSLAYSAGSASGTVERNCATFIIGPFSPPRMRLQILRMRRLVGLHAEEALPGIARGNAAHRAGGAQHPPRLPEEGARPRGQPSASARARR